MLNQPAHSSAADPGPLSLPALPGDDSAQIRVILLVEDDQTTASLIMLVLAEETPYYAFHAGAADQALQFCKNIKPHLFVVDYRLPDMTGIELYDRLHAVQELESIPALILSAADLPLDEIKERRLVGLNKPFDLDKLLSLIESLLSSDMPGLNWS